MRADVVVIGAGALGLSSALHCALAGHSVVIVERETAGSQATGRAAGLFKSVQADAMRTALARRSIELAASFADWAGEPLELVRTGSFLVARTAAHQAYLRTEQRQSRDWGVSVQTAAPGELAGRVPWYRGGGRELALWCPEDAYIEEPASLVRAYLAAARRHGAELLEHEAVTAIAVRAGRVDSVQTTERSITAGVVVDAAGAWSRQVAELAGGTLCLAPVRHQLLITEPAAGLSPADPIVRVVDAAVYLRPARGGLMLGGFEAGPLPVDPRAEPCSFRTEDVPLDPAVLATMAGQVSAEVPLAGGPVAELRGGLFTMSPDGRFVLGPVPGITGLWAASGCNGSGFSSSPALGEALAAQITGTRPAIDVSALAPGRFGPVSERVLVSKGVWQYAHYYDPAPAAQ